MQDVVIFEFRGQLAALLHNVLKLGLRDQSLLQLLGGRRNRNEEALRHFVGRQNRGRSRSRIILARV